MNPLSIKTECEVTLTIDGVEHDRIVRAWVMVEPGLGMGGSWGAAIDGDIEVYVGDLWWPLAELTLDDGADLARAEEALLDCALQEVADAAAE